jgi:hypothetical protein
MKKGFVCVVKMDVTGQQYSSKHPSTFNINKDEGRKQLWMGLISK